MSFWQEQLVIKPAIIMRTSKNGRSTVCVRYPSNTDNEPSFSIFLGKWTEENEPERWDFYPQGWTELWPIPPIKATSFLEARELQNGIFLQLESGELRIEFEEKSPQTEFIELSLNSSNALMSRIYRHSNGIFEVKYFRQTSGRGGGWLQVRHQTCTFADDLVSARQAIEQELPMFETQ